ncbi:secreted RxLR effector protein 161-like [Dioscorea cayenensis subsp. rotundata]|uniref:Secreted RxLR effector protein 161-like n=1 Tax=Dioscorea cayennensis subsp. rotundata TaxID=55577 RepID=A0AB40CAB9_DIOCR|nr:secreted RxLR effector protein 161-like [Dioscorea cayenensis subsp. rotundata]
MVITGDDVDTILSLKQRLHTEFQMKDLGPLRYFLGLELLPDPTRYCALVGALVYLTITRSDIAYVVHVLSQFVSAPRSTHYAALLRVLRYLHGIISLSLLFSATSSFELRAYCDADWVDSLISWKSKKQSTIALSTAEAEYDAMSSTAEEVLWLRQILMDFGVSILILLPYVPSTQQIADLFTKAHTISRFQLLFNKLSVHDPP